MWKRTVNKMFCVALLMVTASAAQQTTAVPSSQPGTALQGRIASAFSNLPLTFEANRGQTSASAKFIARGSGYSTFLTTGGLVLSLRSSKTVSPQAIEKGFPSDSSPSSRSILEFNLMGATQNPMIVGENEQTGRVNYFIGKDPKGWHTNVPTYARVRYKNVYPGIDLVYYGNHRQLEYDFEVSASANPNLIQFEIKGANQIQLDHSGNLILTINGGDLHFESPVVYQQSQGKRLPLQGGYVLKDATHVGFSVAHFDPTKPLVIDPVLVYSTYLGGRGDDEPHGIAIDSTGSIYVAGDTDSPDFPGTSVSSLYFGMAHAFVAKLNASGSSLVYADYLGGDAADAASALVLDSADEVYLTGITSSDDFPTVLPYQAALLGTNNAFLSKMSADGSTLLYSSYLGGNGSDESTSIALNTSGNIVVGGLTSSTNFPVANPFQSFMLPNQGEVYGNYGFLTEFSSTGASLAYSTYFGGSSMVVQTCWNGPCWFPPFSIITGLALDAGGNAYVAGYTNTYDFPVSTGAYNTTNTIGNNTAVGFVSKFDTSGSLAYSSYLYGSGGAQTNLEAITVDASGSAYVAGTTTSDGTFPITSTTICDPGVYGLGCSYTFVTKFDPTGSSLLYSTFLGPNNNAAPQAIALDAGNDAYILGMTWTCDSFAMVNGIESCEDAGSSDLLLVEIDPTGGTELFATYLGGAQDSEYPAGIALDSAGNIYVGGETFSGDFPTTEGAYQDTLNGTSNAFVVKISPEPAPGVSVSPFTLQFGSQDVGSTSPTQSALLRNTGSSPLLISSLTALGDFSQTNDCGSTVPAAGSCTFTVAFDPTTAGVRSGSIVIEDNAAGSPHSIELSGTAPGPVAALPVSNLAFSSQSVGTSSAAQPVTLTNAGNLPLNIGLVQITGDFSQINNCPAALAANSSCTFNVTFTPTSSGSRSGTLSVSDDAQGPQIMTLTGVGTDFTFTSSQNNTTVQAGATASYQFTVSSMGNPMDRPIKLSCSGAPAATSCSVSPSAVTPNGSTTATLTISTTASIAQSLPVRPVPIYVAWMQLQGIGLFGMILVTRKSRSRKSRPIFLLVLMIGVLLLLAGCAGSSRPASPAPARAGATPGTYTITVTGTSGTLQHSFPVTLTIQ